MRPGSPSCRKAGRAIPRVWDRTRQRTIAAARRSRHFTDSGLDHLQVDNRADIVLDRSWLLLRSGSRSAPLTLARLLIEPGSGMITVTVTIQRPLFPTPAGSSGSSSTQLMVSAAVRPVDRSLLVCRWSGQQCETAGRNDLRPGWSLRGKAGFRKVIHHDGVVSGCPARTTSSGLPNLLMRRFGGVQDGDEIDRWLLDLFGSGVPLKSKKSSPLIVNTSTVLLMSWVLVCHQLHLDRQPPGVPFGLLWSSWSYYLFLQERVR